MAAERAAIMLGCYRRGEVADEEIFTRGVIAVLCAYPQNIVCEVTDPATGLPSKMQWLPTIAEIKAACEARYEPVLRQREADYRRLMQQRARLAAPEVSVEDRARAVAHWRSIRNQFAEAAKSATEESLRAEAEQRIAANTGDGLVGARLSDEALSKLDRDARDRGWAA